MVNSIETFLFLNNLILGAQCSSPSFSLLKWVKELSVLSIVQVFLNLTAWNIISFAVVLIWREKNIVFLFVFHDSLAQNIFKGCKWREKKSVNMYLIEFILLTFVSNRNASLMWCSLIISAWNTCQWNHSFRNLLRALFLNHQ